MNEQPGRPKAEGRPEAQQEAELVSRAQRGDLEAFTGLVTACQDRVYNLLLRLCPQRDDAEELAQETFCKAFEKLGTFRGGSRFYTWVYRIATNLALSRRRRGRKVKFQSLCDPGGDGQSETLAQAERSTLAGRREPSPPAAAMQNETAGRISRALGELDEEYRTAVVLRDLEGLDYAEIAVVLDTPVGTVKSRIYRGRAELRDKLRDLVNES